MTRLAKLKLRRGASKEANSYATEPIKGGCYRKKTIGNPRSPVLPDGSRGRVQSTQESVQFPETTADLPAVRIGRGWEKGSCLSGDAAYKKDQ